MPKIIYKRYSVGLVLLLLAMFLGSGLLAFPTYASAQTVQNAQVAHTALPTHDQMRMGKVIIVDLAQQYLYAYQNGQEVFSTPVLAGRAALPTPVGTYHIFKKLSPTTFISPFPRRSPYWYPPTHISYALQFREPGYFLHDSWWHTVYGAGTNGHHYDPVYGWQEGSHGCVSMPLNAARWLYYWAPLGTTVRIVR